MTASDEAARRAHEAACAALREAGYISGHAYASEGEYFDRDAVAWCCGICGQTRGGHHPDMAPFDALPEHRQRYFRAVAEAVEAEWRSAVRQIVDGYASFRGHEPLWWLEQYRDHGWVHGNWREVQPDPEKAVSSVSHDHLLDQLIAAEKALSALAALVERAGATGGEGE